MYLQILGWGLCVSCGEMDGGMEGCIGPWVGDDVRVGGRVAGTLFFSVYIGDCNCGVFIGARYGGVDLILMT